MSRRGSLGPRRESADGAAREVQDRAVAVARRRTAPLSLLLLSAWSTTAGAVRLDLSHLQLQSQAQASQDIQVTANAEFAASVAVGRRGNAHNNEKRKQAKKIETKKSAGQGWLKAKQGKKDAPDTQKAKSFKAKSKGTPAKAKAVYKSKNRRTKAKPKAKGRANIHKSNPKKPRGQPAAGAFDASESQVTESQITQEPAPEATSKITLPLFRGPGLKCQRLEYPVMQVAARATEWCSLDRVPLEQRPPKKLQGLYWYYHYGGSGMFMCFNLGKWDAASNTLVIPTYEAIAWKKTNPAKYLMINTKGRAYKVKFDSPKLDTAKIQATGASIKDGGSLSLMVQSKGFAQLTNFEMRELPGGSPGEKWDRISAFRTGQEIAAGRYQLWRILDGNLKKVKGTYDEFKQKLAGADMIVMNMRCG